MQTTNIMEYKNNSVISLLTKTNLALALLLSNYALASEPTRATNTQSIATQSAATQKKAQSQNYSLPECIINLAKKHTPSDYLIDLPYVLATIHTESRGNPRATSRVGARGLMQIMEPTWREVSGESFDKAYDPEANIITGVKYLKTIEKYIASNNPRWDNLNVQQKLEQIAASYNGGIGRLRRNNWQIEKMPTETRDYVQKVLEKRKFFTDKLLYPKE